MNILIDGLIIAIFVACAIGGYKSGFVKMAVRFLKNLIAIAVASVFASRIGAILYNTVFKNFFESMTMEKIASFLGVDSDVNLDIGPLLSEGHTEFINFIQKLGFDMDTVSQKYEEIGADSDLMVEYIAKPIGVTVSNVLAFILIFIVTAILISLIGFIIGKIVKLPVLNVTNRILGFVLGAVLGVVFVFIFVSLIHALLPYIKINGQFLAGDAFEDGTIIYKYLVNENPTGFVNDILQRIGVK